MHRSIRVEVLLVFVRLPFAVNNPSHLYFPQRTPLLMPDIVQGLRLGGEQAHPLGHPSGDRIDIELCCG